MVRRVQLIPLDNVSSITTEKIDRIVSTLPPEIQKKATQLLNILSEIDVQISDEDKISYVGQSVGSSLTDLLTWVLSKDQKTPAPLDYMLFMNIVNQANLPDGFLSKDKLVIKDQPSSTKEWLKLY